MTVPVRNVKTADLVRILFPDGWEHVIDDGAFVIKAPSRKVDVLIWDFVIEYNWKNLATFIEAILWLDSQLPKNWAMKGDFEEKHTRATPPILTIETGFSIITVVASFDGSYEYQGISPAGSFRTRDIGTMMEKDKEYKEREEVKIEMREFVDPPPPECDSSGEGLELSVLGCKVNVLDIVTVSKYGLINNINVPTPGTEPLFLISVETKEVGDRSSLSVTAVTDGQKWSSCARNYEHDGHRYTYDGDDDVEFQLDTDHRKLIESAIKAFCEKQEWFGV